MENSLFDGLEQAGFAGGRTLVIAMNGWNDAGEAASTAVTALARQLDLNRVVATFAGDDFYDYCTARPRIVRQDDGQRILEWPATKVHAAKHPQPNAAARVLPNANRLYLLTGAEPSMRWRQYASEVVEFCQREEIDRLVVVGALLADTPHTRDVPVIRTSEDESVQQEFDVESSQYEGPTGAMTAIVERARQAGIVALSLWAQVPHYAAAPEASSPKAILALLNALAEILLVEVDIDSFVEASSHWETQVTNAIAMDDEMTQYVKFLEQARDTVDSEAASGDAIAAEFERFLADESPRDEGEDR